MLATASAQVCVPSDTVVYILFVALLIPLSCEDKMIGTALSNSQLTHPLTSGIYDSNFKAHICAEGGRFKLMTEINLVEKKEITFVVNIYRN